jgi:hypothetical protein
VLTEALLKTLPVLNSLDTTYALIGGLTLAPHDVVRTAADLDFLLADSPQRMMELADRLRRRDSMSYPTRVALTKRGLEERGAWKEAAAKLRLGKEYHRCVQFMTR